ncbi:MAG: hypothetical protein L6427_12390 [Actinomycetia bacterium]|nr:hypothetical protein [Actinomycetes bacterium]
MKEEIAALTDSELRVALAFVQGLRDQLAKDGKPHQAAVFAALLAELAEEKRDRGTEWKRLELAAQGLTAEDLDDDAEWTSEIEGH